MAYVEFKRVGYPHTKKLLIDNAVKTAFDGRARFSVTVNENEDIDAVSVKAYGSGKEAAWRSIASKNADRLLAWDLSTKFIKDMDVP